MGLAASALGRLGSGPPWRVTIIATSRVRATTKEAAEKYGWKRLATVNSDNALNASRAIQEIIETVLMFTDIFISLRPSCAAPNEGGRYTDRSLEEGPVRRACFEQAVRRAGSRIRATGSHGLVSRAGRRCSTAGGEFLAAARRSPVRSSSELSVLRRLGLAVLLTDVVRDGQRLHGRPSGLVV